MVGVCELPKENPNSREIEEILRNSKVIAIIGVSRNPEKDSHKVAKYLMEKGYKVIPVNPNAKEILGRKCYPRLEEVEGKIDVVDIFRPPEEVPEIVETAKKKGAKVVWMQVGIVNNQAAEKAKKMGMRVVMNKCIMLEHKRLLG